MIESIGNNNFVTYSPISKYQTQAISGLENISQSMFQINKTENFSGLLYDQPTSQLSTQAFDVDTNLLASLHQDGYNVDDMDKSTYEYLEKEKEVSESKDEKKEKEISDLENDKLSDKEKLSVEKEISSEKETFEKEVLVEEESAEVEKEILSEKEKTNSRPINKEETAKIAKKKLEESESSEVNVNENINNEFVLKNKDDAKDDLEDKKEQSKDKIDRLKQHNDAMYKYAMQEDGDITVNGLYMGSYSDQQGEVQTPSEKQVEQVLSMNGLANTQANQWAVSKLMAIGVDVSPENITKIQNVKHGIEKLDMEEMKSDTILSGNKVNYSQDDINELTSTLDKVSDDEINSILKEEKPVTFENLKEVMHKNTKKALGEDAAKVEMPVEDLSKVQDVKDQINTIRAKLNVETARNISEKLPLESTELVKVAEELIAMEDKIATEALEIANVPVTEENKEILTKVLETTHQMKRFTEKSIEIQIETDETATLEQFNRALSSYDENALEPERRFGENISKVSGQIEHFLELNDLPTDDLSVQSAKALILNQQEVTADNLEEVRVIAQKMNTFLEEMTPVAVAKMIKEGANPYYSTVDNALSFVEEERLPQLKTSIAETIVALEEKGQISSAQKQELIGFYQILDSVQKNKEQVIGYMHQNDLPLTVERLQEAVKYKNEHNISADIDDNFGEIETLEFSAKNARIRMEQAHIQNERMLEVAKNIENESILPLEKNSSSLQNVIFPFIKEQMKQELGKFEGMDTLPNSLLEKAEVAKAVTPQVLEIMEEKQIPMTLTNIYWVDKMVKDPDAFGEMLQNFQQDTENSDAKALDNFPKSFDEIRETLDELKEKAIQEKEVAILQGDIPQYREFKQFEEIIGVQKELQKSEDLYQIPFMINGEQKTVHLFVNKDGQRSVDQAQNNTLKAVISYSTKNMGTVVAQLNLSNDVITYEVKAENAQATNKLENGSDSLNKMIEAIGYSISQAIYSQGDIFNPITTPEQEDKSSKIVRHSDSTFEQIV
ncbi:MAG: hypothetical protein ATN36_05145 [Epulopiscium sp. Nele67-Bin005]|nr:MAG: hypothetical protein ATN36_05145 [Epulopiscium sp. Nele67-Bin005]